MRLPSNRFSIALLTLEVLFPLIWLTAITVVINLCCFFFVVIVIEVILWPLIVLTLSSFWFSIIRKWPSVPQFLTLKVCRWRELFKVALVVQENRKEREWVYYLWLGLCDFNEQAVYKYAGSFYVECVSESLYICMRVP